MGHHLYDENKKLRAENDALRQRIQEMSRVSNITDVADLLTEACTQFLNGEARFVTVRNGEFTNTCFEMKRLNSE